MARTPPTSRTADRPGGLWMPILLLAGILVLIGLLAIPFAGESGGASALGLGLGAAVGLRGDGTAGLELRRPAAELEAGAPRLVVLRADLGAASTTAAAVADGPGSNDVVGRGLAVSDRGLRAGTWTLAASRREGAATVWRCAGGRQRGDRISLRADERAACIALPAGRATRTGVAGRAATASIGVALAFVPPAVGLGRFRLEIRSGSGRLVAVDDDAGHGDRISRRTVAPGRLRVAAVPLSGQAGILITWTCVDDLGVLLDAVAGDGATVFAGSGRRVTCVAQAEDPVAVGGPGAAPTLLPPILIAGSARLRGPNGCVGTRSVRSVVTGRNVARIAFVRDGRIARVVQPRPIGPVRVELRTRLTRFDTSLHTVVVRVRFATGATPERKAMVHRFALCRSSTVAG